jgi:hypothetical protein
MHYVKRCLILASLCFILLPVTARADQKPFDLHGIYLEGCSCALVCTCDLKGSMAKGCRVMGAMFISTGTYGSADLSGVKMAVAVSDKWVRIYVQAKDAAQAEAAGALGRALMAAYGKVETVRNAKIELSGSNGAYTLRVDSGKVMTLKTQPVLGADKNTAVTYTNYPDPLFHTIMQAKVVSGSFKDGKRRFTLKDTNSFFNQDWAASGSI